MRLLLIFGMRFMLSIFLAVIIGRLFFHGTPIFKVSLLASALLGSAYLFEHLGKRGKKEGDS